ncbi:MAG: 2-oxoacid:ferredoxin oxidoreductase subunit beta [Nitrospinota bacterium]
MDDATLSVPLKAKDYKSEVPPTWCPGCGDYGVLNATLKAFVKLELDINKTALVSGIGCSSRFPYFVKTYGMHTAHGRALPVAAGLKVARPDQEVIVFGGDGDGFSIGGGHVPHIARKNTDITYVCMDNAIYGLTKGQMSPTSQLGMITSTTPYGVPDRPMNTLMLVLSYGATFVAQGFSSEGAKLTDIIAKAIEHKGFSFVNIISPCPTFNLINTHESYKGNIVSVPESHKVDDLIGAIKLANDFVGGEKIMTGIYYQNQRETLVDRLQVIKEKAGSSADFDINTVIDGYRP